MTDGLSSTFLFGERAHGVLALPQVSSLLATWTGPALAEYHFWQSGEPQDTLLESWAPPNRHATDLGMPRLDSTQYLAANASSFHPDDGASFAFCDGSVRFVRTSIDSWPLSRTNIPTSIAFDDRTRTWYLQPGEHLGVYQALSTRAGGESVAGWDE